MFRRFQKFNYRKILKEYKRIKMEFAQINKVYPKQWQKIKGKWEQIFPQITVEVDVRANINQVGLTVLAPVPLPE